MSIARSRCFVVKQKPSYLSKITSRNTNASAKTDVNLLDSSTMLHPSVKIFRFLTIRERPRTMVIINPAKFRRGFAFTKI